MSGKTCTMCKMYKACSCFSAMRAAGDGLKSACKDCLKARRKPVKITDEVRRQATASGVKQCRACGLTKSLELFYKYRDSRDGRGAACKECFGRKYILPNSHQRQEYRRQWRQKNPDLYSAQKKRDVAAQRERESADPALYQKRLAERRRRFAQNPHLRAKRNERSSVWQKANPDRKCVYRQSRRARIRGAVGRFSRDEWVELCRKYEGTCLCCREKRRLSADHIIPLSRGGANDIGNIQPLCVICNSAKGTKVIDYRPEFSSLVYSNEKHVNY